MSIRLDGCRAHPLGSYLQGLGVWRALNRTGLTGLAARWESERLVLDGVDSIDQIVNHLIDSFTPLPIVSPWNAGSGFAGNGKSASAERLLAQLRDASDDRLAPLCDAVLAADAVVAEGRRRGWGGKGTDLWSKAHKEDVIQLSRNLLPDAAVTWIDAAVVLGDDPTFSRLLGTGGNFGRQDLSVTYIEQALRAVRGRRRERELLLAALTADETVRYDRGTVGQFDPGRAGGIQSSPLEKGDDKGFVNAWNTLLSIEGALFFTSTVGRRQGSQTAVVAVPFQVRGSTSGFASAALDEDVTAEIWTPTWSRPASIDEVEQLMRDGRAEWGRGPARSGLEFALAVRSLGTDRGIDRFTRNVVVNRLGQSPLAITAGVVEVPTVDRASGLAPIERWLRSVRRVSHLPRSITSTLLATEDAMLEASRNDTPATRTALIRQLGRLHRLVERSSAANGAIRPLVLHDPVAWVDRDGALELRLAIGFASAHDRTGPLGIVRHGLGRVTFKEGRVAWAQGPSSIDDAAPLSQVLADIHVRRASDLRTLEQLDLAEAGDHEPAVKGICTGPEDGCWTDPADLDAWCRDEADAVEVRDLLDGYLLFDWRRGAAISFSRPHRSIASHRPSLSVLLAFASRAPLEIASTPESSAAQPVLLRASTIWPAQLRAGRTDDVLNNAVFRLSAAGVQGLPPATAFRDRASIGSTLSSCLLVNVSGRDRIDAVRRIGEIPSPRPSSIESPSPETS